MKLLPRLMSGGSSWFWIIGINDKTTTLKVITNWAIFQKCNIDFFQIFYLMMLICLANSDSRVNPFYGHNQGISLEYYLFMVNWFLCRHFPDQYLEQCNTVQSRKWSKKWKKVARKSLIPEQFQFTKQSINYIFIWFRNIYLWKYGIWKMFLIWSILV